MNRVNGIITEDIRVKAIKESPIEIGAWVKIQQSNGKECSGLICNYASLEYCYLHEDKLERGALVEITGIILSRQDNDFMIIDEGVGIRILN